MSVSAYAIPTNASNTQTIKDAILFTNHHSLNNINHTHYNLFTNSVKLNIQPLIRTNIQPLIRATSLFLFL